MLLDKGFTRLKSLLSFIAKLDTIKQGREKCQSELTKRKYKIYSIAVFCFSSQK